jgi:hypothetical protein
MILYLMDAKNIFDKGYAGHGRANICFTLYD